MKTFLLTIATAMMSQCNNAHVILQTANSGSSATASGDTTVPPSANKAASHSERQKPAYATIYSDEDKTKAEALIAKFGKRSSDNASKLVIDIARELRGIPYVAKTLENDSTENLVVNLRQLDCTTYVENVLAIYLCVKNGSTSFDDFCQYLRKIRYAGGVVSYPSRQHYFTEWIDENTKDGFVDEVNAPNPPFTATQHLNINFMSTHAELYPMLKGNPEMVKPIADMEKRLSGKDYRYIPKSKIANNALFRSTIHDGDIIAITTAKGGLDTSHIGIAVWHKDGLHMLNASQIHKKVVEEPMTLYQYMQKHPSQTGIRIVRIL